MPPLTRLWLKQRKANILAPLAWTHPTQGMWGTQVIPNCAQASKWVCREEREVSFLDAVLVQLLPARRYFAKNLIFDQPNPLACLNEVDRNTSCHVQRLKPMERPALGLGGWFYHLIMDVLEAKEPSTEDASRLTKPMVKNDSKTSGLTLGDPHASGPWEWTSVRTRHWGWLSNTCALQEDQKDATGETPPHTHTHTSLISWH